MGGIVAWTRTSCIGCQALCWFSLRHGCCPICVYSRSVVRTEEYRDCCARTAHVLSSERNDDGERPPNDFEHTMIPPLNTARASPIPQRALLLSRRRRSGLLKTLQSSGMYYTKSPLLLTTTTYHAKTYLIHSFIPLCVLYYLCDPISTQAASNILQIAMFLSVIVPGGQVDNTAMFWTTRRYSRLSTFLIAILLTV
jgi:hypothetical protein